MNIARLLEIQVQTRGEATAISERHGWPGRRDRTVTFAQLDRLSAAAACASAGLTPGDRAIILAPMSIALYAAMIGMLRAGVVPTFLDPGLGAAHIDACVAAANARAFAGSPRAHLLRLRSRNLRAIPRHFVIGGHFPGATRLDATPRDGDPQGFIIERADTDPALLTFTSGSTAAPKATLRTHAFLATQLRVLRESTDLRPGQTDLTTLPIFLLANLATGVHSVIADADLRRPGAIDAGRLLRQIDAMKPTRCTASPALLQRLIDVPHSPGRLDSFNRIDTGGAPVFPRLLDRLTQAAPRSRIIALYGSTEAEPIAHLDRAAINEADRAAMSRGAGLLAGKPISAIQLRILRHAAPGPVGPFMQAAFDKMCESTGSPGEIVVTGEHVLKGYLDGAGDGETKFQVGEAIWHRTGDTGRLDERGRLWLLGRAEARISDSRGELYPFAVECAAMEHPAIARAALIGHDGRRILIVQRDTTQLWRTDLVPDLRQRVAWASLDDILLVDAIPLDARHNAKVDYPALGRLVVYLLGKQEKP
jgi:acyl-CoA synthetase (AMP-forming)/AMP-acid ligase II